MLSPETLEWLRQTAKQGHSYSLAHLDHVERLDELRESLETALKRIAALESFFERAEAAVAPLLAGGPLPAGAAWTEREGEERFTALPAPAAAPEPIEPEAQPEVVGFIPDEDAAPAGGLVEWIAAMTGCGDGASRAVLREVGAWLGRLGYQNAQADLEQEATRQEGQANG